MFNFRTLSSNSICTLRLGSHLNHLDLRYLAKHLKNNRLIVSRDSCKIKHDSDKNEYRLYIPQMGKLYVVKTIKDISNINWNMVEINHNEWLNAWFLHLKD